MANPNPKTEQLIPFPQVGEEPLSKKPISFRLPQSDYDRLMRLPREQRLKLLRQSIKSNLDQLEKEYAWLTCRQTSKSENIIKMSGTKSSGRPGGNPDIAKYGFKTERPEPLREQINIRVSTSMKKSLLKQKNWNEFVREAIAKALQEQEEELKSA